jgi:hypothetical protein
MRQHSSITELLTQRSATEHRARDLILSSYLGLTYTVKDLLKEPETEPQAYDYVSGFSAMECAATQKYTDIVKVLEAAGASGSALSSSIRLSGALRLKRNLTLHLPALSVAGISVGFGGGITRLRYRENRAFETFENTKLLLIKRMEEEAVILYDADTKRSWLVPAIHIISQMARNHVS